MRPTRIPSSDTSELVVDPVLAHLRETEPVARVVLPHGTGGWLVTRHADACFVQTDPRFSRALAVRPDIPRFTPDPPVPYDLFMMDPPRHTAVRGLLTRWFTARRVAAMRGEAQRRVDLLLDRFLALGPAVDLVEQLALPLPIDMIGVLLGAPDWQYERMRALARGVMATTALSDAQRLGRQDELVAFVLELVEHRLTEPGDDLVSALVRAHDEDDAITEQELVMTIGVLIIAGYETTAKQIGNFVWTLLSDRRRFDVLTARPGLVPRAVEELMRSVPLGRGASFARVATEDVVVSGQLIREGEAVLVSPYAVNYDPRAFRDPEHLDFDRERNPHMTFGHGVHRCVGAAMASMELQVVIGSLVRRFPTLRLACAAADIQWTAGEILRGPRSLPVTW